MLVEIKFSCSTSDMETFNQPLALHQQPARVATGLAGKHLFFARYGRIMLHARCTCVALAKQAGSFSEAGPLLVVEKTAGKPTR